MICEKCLKQIDDDSSFCVYCGTKQGIAGYTGGNLEVYSSGSKFGFKDKDTRDIVTPLKYDFIGAFSDNRAVVKINDKYGYIDQNGKELTRLKYDMCENFKDGFAKVMRDKKWTLIDIDCNEITSFKYDNVDYFENELAKVEFNNKYSFIKKNGDELSDIFYDGIEWCYRDHIKVKLGNKYGVINSDGKEIISCKYNSIKKYSDRLLLVKMDNNCGLLDYSGNEILPCHFNHIGKYSVKPVFVKSGDKYGLMNQFGKIIVECNYDDVFNLDDSTYVFRQNENLFAFSETGQNVSDINSDFINYLKSISTKKKKRIITKSIIVFVSLISISLFIEPSGSLGTRKIRVLLWGEERVFWDECQRNKTLTLSDYLEKYPNGKYASKATEIIENLFWKEVIRINSIEKYENYLRRYPNGRYTLKAEHNILWLKTKTMNTEKAYENFINHYPQSFHAKEANNTLDELVWSNALSHNSVNYYQNYLDRFPNGKYKTKAIVMLKDWKSLEEVRNHLLNDPNGIFVEKAISELEKWDYENYILEVKFRNLNNNSIDNTFNSSELTYIVPLVKLISTTMKIIELSYKIKNPNGHFTRFEGTTQKVKNNCIIYERIIIDRGINNISFKSGWGNKISGHWNKGLYEFIFYIDGEELFTKPLFIE